MYNNEATANGHASATHIKGLITDPKKYVATLGWMESTKHAYMHPCVRYSKPTCGTIFEKLFMILALLASCKVGLM